MDKSINETLVRPIISINDKKTSDIKKTPKNTGFPIDKNSIIPKHIPSPTKVFTENLGRSRIPSLSWEAPEWDLVECGRIIDVESYVRRAFRAKKNLWTKEGYSFVGPKPERVQYIKKRLQQMEVATAIPFHILISQTISSLILYGNAFWVKVRKLSASGGKRRQEGNKTLDPIAGYFFLPAPTVRFKRDEFGKVKKYQQVIWGHKPVEFAPENVVHFYLDKRDAYSIGTPILTPVKDDIRALRRIEENVELLVYQHLFPLFHYQVGTEEAPAATFPNGDTEIAVVENKVALMPSDGCWVTPERHKIVPLTGSAPAIATIDKIIEHFKQRIFTGLGVSSVDMGEGGTSNRSTADTMSRNLIDDTKADQKEFGALFYSYIIRELLLESTFSDGTLLEDENKVVLKFAEIDNEARQAKENHLSDIFLKNSITHDEMRIGMGREPFVGDGWPTGTSKAKMFTSGDGDWAKTNYGLVERDKVLLQSLDEPGTPASKAEAASRTGQNKPSGGSSVSNKNKPKNQHGTRSSAKLNKDSDLISQIASLRSIYLQDPPVGSIYRNTRKDLMRMTQTDGANIKIIELNLGIAFTEAKKRLVSQAKQAFRKGLQDTNRFTWEVDLAKADGKINDHVDKYVTKLNKQLLDSIERNTVKDLRLRREDAVFIGFIFDAFEHRTKMIDKSEVMRAYNYGLANGHKLNGAEKIRSVRHNSSDCTLCNEHFLEYNNSDVIIYNEIPPLHPHCECTMEASTL